MKGLNKKGLLADIILTTKIRIPFKQIIFSLIVKHIHSYNCQLLLYEKM